MKRLRSNDEGTFGSLARKAERHGLTVHAIAPYSEWESWHVSADGTLLVAFCPRLRRAEGLYSRTSVANIDQPAKLVALATAERKLIGKPTPAKRRNRRHGKTRT